jgi:hypothetical protein
VCRSLLTHTERVAVEWDHHLLADQNYNGPASFTYQVCDNGTTNGAPDSKCATATVNVTVNSVNDAPTLNAIANQNVNVGANLSFTAVGSDTIFRRKRSATVSRERAEWSHDQSLQVLSVGHRVRRRADRSIRSPFRVLTTVLRRCLRSERLLSVSANVVRPAGSGASGALTKGRRTLPIKFQLTGQAQGITDANQMVVYQISNKRAWRSG